MKHVVMVAGLLLLFACGSEKMAADNAHNSMNALDWNGRYSGKLACTDCPGIEVNLILNRDLTFEMSSIYLDKPEKVFHTNGTFTWSKKGDIIELSSANDKVGTRYKVIEGGLKAVDADDKLLEGEGHVLAKDDLLITNREWVLFEVQGKRLKMGPDEAAPSLLLEDNGAVKGSTGCNQLNGRFTTNGPMTIRFGVMAATKMFCSDKMDLEKAVFDVLGKCDNYTLSGDTLSLNKAKMAPLARFVQKH